jgi:predicted nicotinamide N-methyase
MRTTDSESLSSTPSITFTDMSLVLAMAPMQDVLRAFLNNSSSTRDAESIEAYNLQVQDSFADAVSQAWNNGYGPSKPYLKQLAKTFIAGVGESNLQSENLLALLVDMLSHCAPQIPDPNDFCYLSFLIPVPSFATSNKTNNWWRLRIYPHHNDVSLRLWEAGAVLAEYILANPLLVRGRSVVELGAGVGLTGLACAASGASLVTCTDYTECALDNLRYNFSLSMPNDSVLKVMHLDWNDVVIAASRTRNENEGKDETTMIPPGLTAVANANVLLAADVIYDGSVVPSLVRLIHYFFESQSLSIARPKNVLFAATLRHQSSMELLEKELASRQMTLNLLASGQDCDELPRLFPTKFVQPRSDVRIYSIQRH